MWKWTRRLLAAMLILFVVDVVHHSTRYQRRVMMSAVRQTVTYRTGDSLVRSVEETFLQLAELFDPRTAPSDVRDDQP